MTCDEFDRLLDKNPDLMTKAEDAALVKHARGCEHCRIVAARAIADGGYDPDQEERIRKRIERQKSNDPELSD